MWLVVAVTLYSRHLYKLWFGSPTEVWSAVTTLDMHFYLLHVPNLMLLIVKIVIFVPIIGNDSVIFDSC